MMAAGRTCSGRALAGAAALAFLYVRMHQAFGFGARFGGTPQRGALDNFLHIAPFEHMFWLCHLTLLVPAAFLAAYALRSVLGPALVAFVLRFEHASRAEWIASGATYGLVLSLLAYVGRDVLLLDLPITDDENAVLFGARVLARGELCAHGFDPQGLFTDAYLHTRDGCTTSMDYPGAIAFRALSLVTHLDAALYAGLSAVTGVAVAHAAVRLCGTRGGLVAALVWLMSPMVATLSMTTHAHLVSRGFLAVAVAFWARIVTLREHESATKNALMAGVAAGLAFTARPVETAALFSPLVLAFLQRKGGGRFPAFGGRFPAFGGRLAAFGGLVVGALGPLLLFAAYNHHLTGGALVSSRAATPYYSQDLMLGPWARLPLNLGFNLVMLAIWFLGPLGIALAAYGAVKRETPWLPLSLGVLLHLLVALGHENTGIHAVGPIHYSETAVPLALLAVRGLLDLLERTRRLGIPASAPAVLFAGYAAIGYGVFTLSHALALHRQALSQRFVFDVVERANVHDAIVLAPRAREFALLRQDETRSWVVEYPTPDPAFRDDVLFARPDADPALLRARFPSRTLYRLVADRVGNIAVVPIRRGPVEGT